MKTEIILFFLFLFSLSVDLNVGEGKTYSTIGEAMDIAGEGDTIYVHYKSDPYREKFVIGYDNFRISGVCTEDGDCPIIDGENAVVPSTQDYSNEVRGVIKIGTSNSPSSICPNNIVVENLHIRNARPPFQFSGTEGTEDYSDNAACVYIECVTNLVIRNNEIENCGNGIFSDVQLVYDETIYLVEDILIEHNYVHSNGIEGSYLQHNLYTAAVGITYQFNHFGPLRSGCDGNNLKDRGVGSIVRYNWIEDGSRQIDLVDQYGEDRASIRAMQYYNFAWVYGNVLFENTNSGNRQIIHFGGDGADEDAFRKGPLYAYYNTIISKRSDDKSTLIRVSSTDGIAYFWNNIVYSDGSNYWEMLAELRGKLYLRNNVIKSGYVDAIESLYGGQVVDEDTTETETEPGFTDFEGDEFTLSAASVCRNIGMMLDCDVAPPDGSQEVYPLYQFFNYTYSLERRNYVDVGAYAYLPSDASLDFGCDGVIECDGCEIDESPSNVRMCNLLL